MTFKPVNVNSINTSVFTSQYSVFSHQKYAAKIANSSALSSTGCLNSPPALAVLGSLTSGLLFDPAIRRLINKKTPHYSGPNVFTALLDPNDIFVYTPVQRPPNDAALLKAFINYNQLAVSQITVVEDISTGFYYAIDGQHTTIRALRLNNPVDARIIQLDSTNPAHNILKVMSDLFITLNTSTPVGATQKNNSTIVHNPNGTIATGMSILSNLKIHTQKKNMVPLGEWHHPRKMSIDRIVNNLSVQALLDSLSFYQYVMDPFFGSNEVKEIDSFFAGMLAIFFHSFAAYRDGETGQQGIPVDYNILEQVIMNGKSPSTSSASEVISDLTYRARISQSVFDAYSQEKVLGSKQWFLDQNDLGDFTGNNFMWRTVGLIDLYINAVPGKLQPKNAQGNVLKFNDILEMGKPRKRKNQPVKFYRPTVPVNVAL